MSTTLTMTTTIAGAALLIPARIILPVPSGDKEAHCEGAESQIYKRFMGYLPHVQNGRIEIKILSAIQFTADMTGYSDAYIAKYLVELGLRAPREAFPADFLRFADRALERAAWEACAPSVHLRALKEYWENTTEGAWPQGCKPCGAVTGKSDPRWDELLL
ncbi:MAG: hypothetical protein KDJ75_05645 [Alphaproteobacteria bacterium]|nr:hypothetical protein [Alphaproteobacteria bacterium]